MLMIRSAHHQVERMRFRYRDRLGRLCPDRLRRVARTLRDLPDHSAFPLESTLIVDLCSGWARQPSPGLWWLRVSKAHGLPRDRLQVDPVF
jgi:hypothetical protein